MNSAVVNRAIRSLAWPVLKDRHFTSFTGRTGWRDRERLIDIVNFQSFNRYNADVLGCTTFSFSINLSIYLADVRSDHHPAVRNDRLRPAEYEGHIRRRLLPSHPSLPRARDVWLVEEDGHNAEGTVMQAAAALTETADSWFAAFGNQDAVLSVLQGVAAPPDKLTWLPGAPDSAVRNSAVGYVALALGKRSTAAGYLRRALEQYQGFDDHNARISRRLETTVPRHLEHAVAMLSGESV
jgi:hypothetical protein